MRFSFQRPTALRPASRAACGLGQPAGSAVCCLKPPGASRGPAPGLPPPAASPPRRRRCRPTPDKPTLPHPCRCSRGAVAQHQPAAARALHGAAAPAGCSSGGGRRARNDAACGHFGPWPLGLPPQLHCALPQPPGAWRASWNRWRGAPAAPAKWVLPPVMPPCPTGACLPTLLLLQAAARSTERVHERAQASRWRGCLPACLLVCLAPPGPTAAAVVQRANRCSPPALPARR